MQKSQRVRIFEFLAKNAGATVAEVKKGAKLPDHSGSVFVIFQAGLAEGHITRRVENNDGRDVQIYSLTAKGKKLLKDGFPRGTSGIGAYLADKGWVANGDSKPKAAKKAPKAKAAKKPAKKAKKASKPKTKAEEIPEAVAAE